MMEIVEDTPAETRPAAPRVRGPLLTVEDVQQRIYHGRKSLWWIRRNFAPAYKIKMGKHLMWFEGDGLAWLDAQRGLTPGNRRTAG